MVKENEKIDSLVEKSAIEELELCNKLLGEMVAKMERVRPLLSKSDMAGILSDDKLLRIFCTEMAAMSKSTDPLCAADRFYGFINNMS
jgi:hypothetical protein